MKYLVGLRCSFKQNYSALGDVRCVKEPCAGSLRCACWFLAGFCGPKRLHGFSAPRLLHISNADVKFQHLHKKCSVCRRDRIPLCAACFLHWSGHERSPTSSCRHLSAGELTGWHGTFSFNTPSDSGCSPTLGTCLRSLRRRQHIVAAHLAMVCAMEN